MYYISTTYPKYCLVDVVFIPVSLRDLPKKDSLQPPTCQNPSPHQAPPQHRAHEVGQTGAAQRRLRRVVGLVEVPHGVLDDARASPAEAQKGSHRGLLLEEQAAGFGLVDFGTWNLILVGGFNPSEKYESQLG